MADNEPQPKPVISERVITSPEHGVRLTDRVISDCEIAGMDLIDAIVQAIMPIKDSKGEDITEKARGKLQDAWSATLKHTLAHQRSNMRKHQGPEGRQAENSLELIARLRDSRDTMSGMMARQGIQSDSWSEARKTLHAEVMNRYDGMIAALIHQVWGHRVAPNAPSRTQ